MGRKNSRPTERGKSPGQSNQVRIIGGLHRGRKIRFPDHQGLRPTSDRVRETLFNWLQPCLPGSSCLDLFSGSGALGLEAASRGAARVTMLEKAPVVARQLEENRRLLALDRVEVIQADALEWLKQESSPYDIVFLDPPFAENLLSESVRLLDGGWLKSGTRIYLEMDLHGTVPQLPESWSLLKEKKAGSVAYRLYSCENGEKND